MKKLIQPTMSYTELRRSLQQPQGKLGSPKIADLKDADPKIADLKDAKGIYKFRVPIPDDKSTPSHEYAALVRAYGMQDAMKMLMASSLKEWIPNYKIGNSRVFVDPPYQTSGKYASTTRVISTAIIDDARRRLDPLNRRSDSWIARRLVVTAIAEYLDRH